MLRSRSWTRYAFDAIPEPLFSLFMNPSLVPDRSTGSPTPTFTRATAGEQIDFEGKSNQVPSGCVRFQGARYVRNLLTFTEAFDNAAWLDTNSGGGAGATKTPNAGTAPDGTQTACRVQLVRAGGFAFFRQNITGLPNPHITLYSCWMKSNTGSSQNVKIGDGATRVQVTVTTSWQRMVSNATSVASTGSNMDIGIDTGADVDILIWHPMAEAVLGQTNQNPSEYVSVSVLSAPFHGAGVDGVKYFSYLNGNTVASNVVTEAQGAAINSSNALCAGGVAAGVVDASGPTGYLAEPQRINACIQSDDLATTWTVSAAADVEAVVANQYVAVTGAQTADKLQCKSTNSTHYYTEAFTWTAAIYSIAADLRYVNNRWAAIVTSDGTTTRAASFDLLNGVVGAVSNCTSTISATGLTGVYRCIMTHSTNTAAAAGSVSISMNNSDSASLESWNAAGTELLGASGVQWEVGAYASSRIPTTTGAVTKNAAVDQYVSAGNINSSAFCVVMQIAPSVGLGSTTVFHWASYVAATDYTAILSDGTNLIARKRIGGVNHDATIAWSRAAKTVVKIAARFDTVNGVDIFLSGVHGTNDSTVTASQIGAAFQVGADGNGANQDSCSHRLITFYPRALSAQKLIAMTS